MHMSRLEQSAREVAEAARVGKLKTKQEHVVRRMKGFIDSSDDPPLWPTPMCTPTATLVTGRVKGRESGEAPPSLCLLFQVLVI